MEDFKPGPDSGRAFRDCLGQFATGVTVVTIPSDTGPMGITANSFASVSLDPPLVLWSPAKASLRYPYYVEAKHFAIHVLAADQEDVARGFAGNWHAFDGLDWHVGAQGVPLIDGCIARFECTQYAAHEGGDHTIIVGHVDRAQRREGAPLLFACGQYSEVAAKARN